MKVLLIKPMEHPQVVDIENSLKEFYRMRRTARTF